MPCVGTGPSYVGDVDFGPDAAWGDQVYNKERLRWFDRWLKEVPNGLEEDPPIRIFVMGGGDGRRNSEGRLNHGGMWRAEKEWPLARTKSTTYYFHASGELSLEIPRENDSPARFLHDPDDPVPTIAANVTGFYEQVALGEGMADQYTPPRARMRSIIMDGAAHQKEEPGIVGAKPPYMSLAARPDVLVFQTSPLDEDIEVTGAMAVNLWISSSAIDTDFTAKLIDVYPPNEDYPAGYHLNLVDSIIRTRYREGWEEATLMEPGESLSGPNCLCRRLVISSRQGTGFGSIYRAATSHDSISTQTPVNRWDDIRIQSWRKIQSILIATALHILSCLSFPAEQKLKSALAPYNAY